MAVWNQRGYFISIRCRFHKRTSSGSPWAALASSWTCWWWWSCRSVAPWTTDAPLSLLQQVEVMSKTGQCVVPILEKAVMDFNERQLKPSGSRAHATQLLPVGSRAHEQSLAPPLTLMNRAWFPHWPSWTEPGSPTDPHEQSLVPPLTLMNRAQFPNWLTQDMYFRPLPCTPLFT